METTNISTIQPYVLNAEEGGAIWYVNNRATIKATAADTGGAFSLVDMQVAIGHGPPLHIHHTEDEAFWVLEGHLTVRCGEEVFSAGPGSFVYTPRGIPHTFRLEGETPARLLVLLVPGGGEGFFIEAGRPAEGPGLPVPKPPDVSYLASVAAKYHLEFVGPPLPPESDQ
jgi:mannose-6-phosphate isomerase-like protein (cupin superfamily)